MDAPPAELLLAQTEDYVEYSRHGTVIKGQERAVACSKYEEDVKINNHTVCVELELYCVLVSILFWIIFSSSTWAHKESDTTELLNYSK